MCDKAEVRKRMALLRSDLQYRREKNCKITENVLKLLWDKLGDVFVYVSFGSEADTHTIIRELFSSRKVFVPFTYGGFTVPVVLDSPDRLGRADRMGNVYELTERPQRAAESPKITIVPMLAFDETLFRLGYGGGYYDRYLAGADTLKIGLAYDEQCAHFPHEHHDVRLNMIVTPTCIHYGE